MQKITEKDIGRKVSVTGENYGETFKNNNGKICNIRTKNSIGICFEDYSFKGHNCHGTCKDGYGWYVNPEMITFIDEPEINLDDYEIKPFTLIDLLKKDPDKEMFIGFMEDWKNGCLNPDKLWNTDKYSFSNFKNLNKNIAWLIGKGFVALKETKLVPGMRLEPAPDNRTDEFIVTEDQKLCNLIDGKYWPSTVTTLEKLNSGKVFKFKIKK